MRSPTRSGAAGTIDERQLGKALDYAVQSGLLRVILGWTAC